MNQKTWNSDKVFNVINSMFIVILILIVAYPLLFVVSASVSDPIEVLAGRMWLIPRGFNLEAYRRIIDNNDLWNGYRNTIIYTTLGTAFGVTLTMMGAYPLSRKKFFGRGIIMAYFAFTMFFSGGLIPTYLLVTGLGFYNNLWVMIIPGAVSVFNMIVARTFLQSTIPEDLYEAAYMDGASDFKMLFMIVLPLSAPILSVLVLLYAVGHWNSFFHALIYLRSRSLFPLQIILREILIMGQVDTTDALEMDMHRFLVTESIKYAVIIVSTVPILIIYPFLQRFFIKGIMIGAIKG